MVPSHREYLAGGGWVGGTYSSGVPSGGRVVLSHREYLAGGGVVLSHREYLAGEWGGT